MSEEESIVNANEEIRGKIEVQEENNPRREKRSGKKVGCRRPEEWYDPVPWLLYPPDAQFYETRR